MSSSEPPDDPAKGQEPAANDGRHNESVASKLSQELTNWRRRRTAPRSSRPESPGQTYQSEPARTIKVRGHETLVVRKPKLATKPPINPTPDNE